jgi:hypothetical protein
MLDVHAPEHGINGTRDFFLHLFTITVGLLIALGLEAGVEAVHHRHQRQEAEATIRQELSENRQTLLKMQQNTYTEAANLKKALVFLEDLRAGKKDDPSGIKLGFNVQPLPDAAWRTATTTGAVSYMSYNEAQGFALAYHEQQLYEDTVATTLHEYELLETYVLDGRDPRTLTPADIATALPDLRRTLADLNAMHDWGRGALGSYDDALKQ